MSVNAHDCPAGPLPAEEVRRLDRLGFLAVKSFVPEQAVLEVRVIVEQLVTSRAGFNEGAQFDTLGQDDDPKFIQILNPHNYYRGLFRTDLFLSAQRVARQILGSKCRFAADLLFVKAPRIGTETPWHQDDAFRHPNFDLRGVTIWIPLQPVDAVNGCMQFIPGSHRGEVFRHTVPNGDPKIHSLQCMEGFDPAEAIACPLPLGGATLHTGRTIHYAGRNLSEAWRYAYALYFDSPPTPVSSPRSFPWQSQMEAKRRQREKAWLLRGGFVVLAYRKLRRLSRADFQRIRFYFLRLFS
jgi:phytanoyl-CoA dioxygenase PhyH